MNRRLAFASGLAIALAAAAPAGAQPTLTFEEAIHKARANSLSAEIARSKLAQSQHQVDQVMAGIFPQLSLSSSALSYRSLDANSMIGGFGGSIGTPIGMPITINMVQNSVTLSQVLFDGYQVSAGLKIAQATMRINEIDRDNQTRQAAYTAATSYLQVLRATALRHVALQALEQAQSHLEAAQARERAGTGTRFDVLQAETQLASVQGQLRSTTNGVDLARLALSNALGEPLGDRVLNDEVLVPSVQIDLATDLQPALENRPELQTLVAKRRLDEANFELNQTANYPKAQAQAQYSQQGLGTGRTLSLTAGLQWPILDWGKAASKAQASHEDLRQTDLNLEIARRNLAMDLQSASLSRADAHDRLAIAAKGLSTSRESFRMAQVRYGAGVGTGYEVLDAQTLLVQAQNTYVQAQYDLEAAEIRLAQCLGVDLSEMLTLAKRS